MKIVGPYTSPTIYSENPGIVELTSSDPSVASVDASVVISGTRAWRNGLKHGQYLARANCLQARENITYFVKIKKSDIGLTRIPQVSSGMDTDWLIQNVRSDLVGRVNWAIGLNYAHASVQTIRAIWGQSSTSGSSPVCSFAGSYFDVTAADDIRLIFYAASMPSTSVDVYFSGGVAPDVTIVRSALTSGTMGGTEAMVISLPGEYAILSGLASQAQRTAFISAGTLPSGLAVSYQGGHEIDPAAPVFWDTSGNDLDLSAVDVDYWPPAGASGDYTDDPGDPVVPFQPFTITPNSTGTFTITARRRRQGVPDRATDEEKYETTSETFTITEMPAEVVQYVRLLITTSTPGTVDIASSDPSVVTFPSSVVVGPTLQYEVLGTVVGAGTSTITTSMGGAVLDTTTVTIEDTPTVIEAGPPQNLRARL